MIIVAALVLDTGDGDNSSSSVSAIVPHLALLPPPARSSSILVGEVDKLNMVYVFSCFVLYLILNDFETAK